MTQTLDERTAPPVAPPPTREPERPATPAPIDTPIAVLPSAPRERRPIRIVLRPIVVQFPPVNWTTTRRVFGSIGLVFGAAALLASVGGPAGVASYGHQAEVFLRYGETEAMSRWLPLTTDGLLIAALIVMTLRRVRREKAGFLPWFAFVAGMIATLGANLAAADLHGATAEDLIGRIAVAVWPPICVAFVLELVVALIKGGRKVRKPAPSKTTTKRADSKTTGGDKPPSKRGTGGRTTVTDEQIRETVLRMKRENNGEWPAAWAVRQELSTGGTRTTRIMQDMGAIPPKNGS